MQLVFIVYDGIENPVFAGQVIAPILKQLNEEPDLIIHLICFEKNLNKNFESFLPKHERLVCRIFKRFAVIGKISLLHSVVFLKKYLKNIEQYCIKARGPLAAFVALNAIDQNKCTSFLVQARGLIAVEYEMHLKKKNFLHKLRERIFASIEKQAYNPKKLPNNFCIESVSQALSDYLIENYSAEKRYIKLASYDVPQKISSEQIEAWKQEIRNELKLDSNVHIYCYNGSSKPWQDIDLTIEFFKDKLKENADIFLLVLTQDKSIFEEQLQKANIDKNKYKVITIKHEHIYKYLSACNEGLCLRKNHLSNWISRPIKALEYRAVGLKILHNNTVKWLIDLEK